MEKKSLCTEIQSLILLYGRETKRGRRYIDLIQDDGDFLTLSATTGYKSLKITDTHGEEVNLENLRIIDLMRIRDEIKTEHKVYSATA